MRRRTSTTPTSPPSGRSSGPVRTSGSRERHADPRVDEPAAARDPDAAAAPVRGRRARLRRGPRHLTPRARRRQGPLGRRRRRAGARCRHRGAARRRAARQGLASRRGRGDARVAVRPDACRRIRPLPADEGLGGAARRDDARHLSRTDAARPRPLRRGGRGGGTGRRVRDPGSRSVPRRADRRRLPERGRPAGCAARAPARHALRRRLRIRLMPRVHADELDIHDTLVRALLAEQFPHWADLPLARAGDGTVNAIFRLGDELSLRLPRRDGPEEPDDTETHILAAVAPALPVEVPRAVAAGRPGAGYPWHWSIHTWIEGELPEGPLALDDVAGLVEALQRIDTRNAPEPGGGRGKPLALRDPHVRDALERVEAPGASELWERAMQAPEWAGARVWIHADLDRRNVLVRGGRLTGVLDWGGAGLADPAVDLMVAWKLVAAHERDPFRERLGVDD